MNNKDRCMKIIKKFSAEYPEADTMLEFSSLFELLIAVILSAQSTDEQVNKVTRELFKKYNTPQDFSEINREELEGLIRGVGIYKNKAKSIKEMSIIIRDRYNGEVPSDFDELIKLPGVGRKTANVVLAVGFNKPGLGVDTHVHRVTNRLGIVDTKNAEQTEMSLKALIPVELWSKAHHLFIFHGRRVCKAKKPACSSCVVENLCAKRIE